VFVEHVLEIDNYQYTHADSGCTKSPRAASMIHAYLLRRMCSIRTIPWTVVMGSMWYQSKVVLGKWEHHGGWRLVVQFGDI